MSSQFAVSQLGAVAANVAAMAMVQRLLNDSRPSSTPPAGGSPPPSAADRRQQEIAEEEKEAAERQNAEDDDAADEVSYKPYRPQKVKFGKPHPDPVVENSTLSAVEPPDITYNLAIPADLIAKGKLSNLQLEAVVYGSQRHEMNLPKPPKPKEDETENISPIGTTSSTTGKPTTTSKGSKRRSPQSACSPKDIIPERCGFMLGDGAGMGKGRTLAAFCYENIMRGRTKHIWVSVSGDLYQDAKRDLKDLGLEDYATKHCHLLGKMPYTDIKAKEGLIFATYRTLIGVSNRGTRLGQLLDWCGEDFDGLILLDECHKAKNIKLNAEGNVVDSGTAECSRTAAAVVDLQRRLPRARVVYCSATAVSEPFNLGFMSRLGLWGPGTEHPSGFNQFLESIKRLGCGKLCSCQLHCGLSV